MSARAERVVDALLALDPLADLPRTGWLMRGVKPCESIADHSFGVVLCTTLLVDCLREDGRAVDGERALRMALVHDAPEAALGDVPHPVKTERVDAALSEVEATLAGRLLPPGLAAVWRDLEAGESLEARIVKAADKLHMLAKAVAYERRGWAGLDEFWSGPVDDRGLPVVREILDALRARRPRPSG